MAFYLLNITKITIKLLKERKKLSAFREKCFCNFTGAVIL